MIKRYLILIVLGLISPMVIQAGIWDFKKRVFDENQDFNGVFIYSITQDLDGFLWIGSDDGLYRFDGKTMLNLNKADTTVGDLVTATYASPDGHLFLGYYHGGLSKVVHSNYQKLIPKHLLSEQIIKILPGPVTGGEEIIAMTAKGSLVISMADSLMINPLPEINDLIIQDFIKISNAYLIATSEGVFEMDIRPDGTLTAPKVWKAFQYQNVDVLYLDDQQMLWIGTDEGLYYGAEKSKRFTSFKPLQNQRVNCIVRDMRDNLWVGTQTNGLYEIIGDVSDYRITHFTKAKGFESDEIKYLFVDREDEIWVGTFGKGLVQLNRGDFHHYNLGEEMNLANANSITNYQEEILIGTDNGLVIGFRMPFADSLNFRYVPAFAGQRITKVYNIYDRVLIAAEGQGIYGYDGSDYTQLPVNDRQGQPVKEAVRTIELLKNGHVLISFEGRGIFEYDKNWGFLLERSTMTQFYHNEIFAIQHTLQGNLWFGAHGAGLAYLDQQTQKIQYLSRDKNFPAHDINAITSDGDRNIWIATSGMGVYKYDGEEFTRYAQQEGLLSDFANGLIVDLAGQVWVSHRKGLSLINPQINIIRTFKHPEEMGETEALLNAMDMDREGNIWLGNPKGITKVVLPHIHHQVKERNIHITDVLIFFKKEDLKAYSNADVIDNILPGELDFPYNKNHLTMDFVAVNLKNPEGIYYQYKLEGFDEEWSPITQTSLATYTNLNPGDYTFMVKESDHPDYWGDHFASVSFEIDYPYWEKWWFYILELSIIALVVGAAFKFLSRVENKFIARLLIYVSVFMIFEFIHTRFEPYLEKISGDIPIFQVAINLVLALLLFPVEGVITFLFRKKAIKDFQKGKNMVPKSIQMVNKVFTPDRERIFFNYTTGNHTQPIGPIYFATRNPETGKYGHAQQFPHFNDYPGNRIISFGQGTYSGMVKVEINGTIKVVRWPEKMAYQPKGFPKMELSN